jgi:hypothetical protein
MESKLWSLCLAMHDYQMKVLQRIAFGGRWEKSWIRNSLLGSLGHFCIADAVDSHLVKVPSRGLAMFDLGSRPLYLCSAKIRGMSSGLESA